MDRNELVDEIVKRVAEKLAECGCESTCECGCTASCDDGRPGLLILTPDHGEECHAMLESEAIKAKYRTDCALLKEYNVNLDDYEAVVLFCLSNENLGKLASGVCDTPYTKLASKAILSGKKVYAPTEKVELYRYATTAPAPYYAVLKAKLDLLEKSGVIIRPLAELQGCILGNVPAAEPCTCTCEEITPASAPAPAVREEKEYRLRKRVITERDVSEASTAKATSIIIPANSIVTDLAKDFARTRDIALVRE
jgi:ethanolamine utilization protein